MLKILPIIGMASAIALSVPSSPAKADVDLHLGLQLPHFGFHRHDGPRYRHRGPRYRHYRGPHRISCRQARHIVRRSGFRRIRTVECRGRTYTFNARRHGDYYRVRVNARRGYITNVRPLS